MGKVWIEAIRVRSTPDAIENSAAIIKEEVKQIKESSSAQEVFLMQHGLYEGDMIVSIVWEDQLSPQKTREGYLLATRLESLGPVDHALWLPVKT